jgi:hypothetical protein
MHLGFSFGEALGSIVITLTSITWIGTASAACILCAMLHLVSPGGATEPATTTRQSVRSLPPRRLHAPSLPQR